MILWNFVNVFDKKIKFIVDFIEGLFEGWEISGVKTDLLQINHKTTFEAVCVTQSFAFLMHAKCIIVVYCSSSCCSVMLLVSLQLSSRSQVLCLNRELLNNWTVLFIYKSCDTKILQRFQRDFYPSHIIWKLLKMSHLKFWILAFSSNFCPFKTDLSGNTVWPQTSGFQKLAKLTIFVIFN